nr:MAG: hypothetical protein DIU78_05575 [Pseudomonadota bacterium]
MPGRLGAAGARFDAARRPSCRVAAETERARRDASSGTRAALQTLASRRWISPASGVTTTIAPLVIAPLVDDGRTESSARREGARVSAAGTRAGTA